MLAIADRVACYNATWPDRPPMVDGDEWVTKTWMASEGQGHDRHPVAYGIWVVGAAYGNESDYYGAHPRTYLERVWSMFPDVVPQTDTVLHAFSGSLPAGLYSRCDLRQPSEYPCAVDRLPERLLGRKFRLCFADPPYSAEDAVHYGTPMVNRGQCMRSLAACVEVGGHVVWLDTVWPMHRKSQWRTVGRICLVRSTNHRVRLVSIFERREDSGEAEEETDIGGEAGGVEAGGSLFDMRQHGLHLHALPTA